MKITVLGCGALGQLWLNALERQGHEVQGWLRVPRPWCTTSVTDIDGTMTNRTFIANDALFLSASDLLLVTLKAWQVADALKKLNQLSEQHCPVLLLHNGMGTLDELHNLHQPLLHGITTHAATRNDNVIVHVASGMTHIGPASASSASLSRLAESLHQALPDVAWHNNIAAVAWQKLAVNCIINPLSVQYNCLNGELAAHSPEISLLCAEVAAVMARTGQHCSHESLESYVLQVIHSTAGNVSSMLQDVRARRRTEIDYINGYLIRQARAQGIATPNNNRLYNMIKRKEKSYEYTSPGSGLPGAWH